MSTVQIMLRDTETGQVDVETTVQHAAMITESLGRYIRFSGTGEHARESARELCQEAAQKILEMPESDNGRVTRYLVNADEKSMTWADTTIGEIKADLQGAPESRDEKTC